MTDNKNFDAIIIGGSYSGLSAGMALGRSLRRVLIIDGGKPCNIQAPHSHNFLTQDGKTPKEISAAAKRQVAKYETVTFYNGLATHGTKTGQDFKISTRSGDDFTAKKLILATGVSDQIPEIPGFSECWGISVIHCPYCHGYELRNAKTGILGNGDYGFEFSKMISNWTRDLTLFTNGKSTLTPWQSEKLKKHDIKIVETAVARFEHESGLIKNISFKDGSKAGVQTVYARTPFAQRSTLPKALGCELTEEGYINVDALQRTTVPGIFACGDNTSPMRSISNAVASGAASGAVLNKELIHEEF